MLRLLFTSKNLHQKRVSLNIIEINIYNRVAVPSVVFGILGLATFINLFGMLRYIPLVEGIVLALTTLPNIIFA